MTVKMDEDLLSLDRTNAILATMWDQRNKAEKNLSPEALRQKDDAIGYSLMFNFRNSTDAGFHRLVNRETDYLRADGPKGNVIREHLTVLTKFILLDNLRLDMNEYGSFDDLQTPRKTGGGTSTQTKYEGGIPSLKHLKRFVTEYYPEMIEVPHRLSRGLPRDGRFRLFQTAFTVQQTEEHLKKAGEMMRYYTPDMPLDLLLGFDKVTEIAMLLRTYDPEDLAKLAAYRKDVERAIEGLPKDLVGEGCVSHWMVDQFETYRFTVAPLFQELRWYVELKWFARLAPKSKSALLRAKTKFDYTAEDAKKAIKLASAWYADDPFVFRQALPVSYALQMVGKLQASAFLYEACRSELKLPETEQILCTENLAHVARLNGDNKAAIRGLEDALGRWEKIGPDHIVDMLLMRSWLAGLYFAEGQEIQSSKHREAIMSSIPELRSKAPVALQARTFLKLSDTADLYREFDFERTLLKQGLESSQQDERLSDFTLYFQQSQGDLEAYGKRLWVDGPGRFPHPDTREWRMERIGSNFYEARV